MKMREYRRILFFAGIFIIAAACVPVGEMKEESRRVSLDDAESVQAELDMGAGELRIRGGAEELMEGIFSYNVERWKPEIDYHVSEKRGKLKISQGDWRGIPSGKGKNRWDVFLNEEVPLDLIVDFGAGEGKLDLRGLSLQSLQIDMGVGDLTVDLSGDHKNNVDVAIEGGVGSAAVYLPDDIGVRVKAEKGIGSIDARGLRKRGSVYVNEAYGKSEVTIEIEIEAGIGSIDLRVK